MPKRYSAFILFSPRALLCLGARRSVEKTCDNIPRLARNRARVGPFWRKSLSCCGYTLICRRRAGSAPVTEARLHQREGCDGGCVSAQDSRPQRYANNLLVGGNTNSLLVGEPSFGSDDNGQLGHGVPFAFCPSFQGLKGIGGRRVL